MPLTYAIDIRSRLVTSRGWGVLTESEVVSHAMLLRDDPDFEPTFRQLLDVREVTRIDLTHDAIMRIAQAMLFGPGARRAFVTGSEEQYGLARVFAVYAEMTGNVVEVFRDLAEAEAWLDSDEEPA